MSSIRKLQIRTSSAGYCVKALLLGFWAALHPFVTPAAPGGPRQLLHHHIPVAARNLVSTGDLPGGVPLNLSLGLPLRNEEALTNFLEQLYDPTSPLYHHYLTPEEFTLRFGPSQSDYLSLVRFAESHHLQVTSMHSNRLIVEVRGTAVDIENAFATKLKWYRHPGENRQFFAPSIEPSVESGVPLLDVSGLDSFSLPRPMSLRPVTPLDRPIANAGSAPGGSYRGNDFRAAYAPGVILTGAGQLVGLVEFDGYYTNDITTYEASAGLPNVPLQNISLNGFNGAAGVNNAEVALDIEVAISMAPGLSSVLVYEGTSANSILNRMATDNRAKQLSCSWTFGINATTENIFRQYAAQGQTMFQASGDVGAYSGSLPSPADDPNLTVVGGTTLSTTGPSGGWSSEVTWNWATSGMGSNATSGGISTSYGIPSYQKGIDMSANQGSTSMRNIPDVALTADNVWVVWDNGSKGAFGGTSAATPLWAGFMALVNQQAVANGRSTVGFANPPLYAIGKGSSYSACFHDIKNGNNFNAASPAKFPAAPGFDLCTGWGTPAGQALINALAGGTNYPPAFTANPFSAGSVNEGQPCSGSISSSATDPNPSDPLTFAKVSGPAWLTIGSNGSLSGIPAGSDIGTNTFIVSVTESSGMSNTATMYLNVNGAPAFDSNPFTEPSVNAGEVYTASIAGQGSDPNPGDSLVYAKASGPAWLSISGSGELSGTPANADCGTNRFLVSVSDPGGLSATATMEIVVNGPPAFSPNPILVAEVSVGQPYAGSLTNHASDPNPGASLTFSKVSGPAWLSVAPDGTLSGTPGAGDLGTNTFRLVVTDSSGLASTGTLNVPVIEPSGIALKLSFQPGLLVLSWSGGNSPFQVQIATNLAFTGWQDLGTPVTNNSLSIVPEGGTALYRILSFR